MESHHTKGQALIELTLCLIIFMSLWAGALGIFKTYSSVHNKKRNFDYDNKIKITRISEE
jgi:hypothetical protein